LTAAAATQTLVIFAIRTRRIPFFHSRPSVPLLLAALAVVAVGAVLPASPFGAMLGFQPLPRPVLPRPCRDGRGLLAADRTR
jgi:Mg2+-importing ATPase